MSTSLASPGGVTPPLSVPNPRTPASSAGGASIVTSLSPGHSRVIAHAPLTRTTESKSPAGSPSPLKDALVRSRDAFDLWASNGESAKATRDRFLLGLAKAASNGDTRELLPPLADAPEAVREAQAALKQVLEDEQLELIGALQLAVSASIANVSALMADGKPTTPGTTPDNLTRVKTQLEGIQAMLRTGRRNDLYQLAGALSLAGLAPPSVVGPFKALINAKKNLMADIGAARRQIGAPIASQASPTDIPVDLSSVNLGPRRSQKRIDMHVPRG